MNPDSAPPSVYDYPHLEVLEDDDAEEEDELNSDADEVFTDPVERVPGESLLPSLRLESIIQADGVMGSLALSKEGLYILSIATVGWGQGGHRQASAERRDCVTYRDMAATTQQYQEFMFLQETIPSPVSLSEALQLRELKEKEMLEDDPALTAPTTHSSTTPSASKPKVKNRVPNGKDKHPRRASNGRTESSVPSQIRWDYDDIPAINGHGHPATQAIRGGRESGWTRWPNGQNFMNALPATPQHNGIISVAQPPSIPPLNGHASTSARPRDAETPNLREQPSSWQPPQPSQWSKGLLDKHNLLGDGVASRQATSTTNGHSTSIPPQVASTSSHPPMRESASTEPSNGAVPQAEASGGPSLSLIAQNPGRTIYSQKKPPP
ncbi:hypothetical protein C8J57DRAFT_1279912 [Mycena rebaudengoi]|nr:hypothetical protein C8J57DRAFT_1279912 [Mycena rebaudengoi]